MFKPHHLELFYYVARYGGISAAARHIPYGIGQPAISGQMTDFERQLKVRLFERRPFQLTEPGRLLYAHLGPFYDGLGPLEQQLRGGPAQFVRLAADDLIGPEILPAIIGAIAPRGPGASFEIRTGQPEELQNHLHEGRVHLVITAVDRRIPGVRSLLLARPGLRLLVRRRTKIDSPGYFWRQGRVAEPLICPPAASGVHRAFARGLQALGVEWPAGIRVDSTAVMLNLVASGHGVGLGLEPPRKVAHPGVRAIPLANFEPVPLLALWRPPTGPALERVLAAVRDAARRLWPAAALPTVALLIGRWLVLADELSDLLGLLAWE